MQVRVNRKEVALLNSRKKYFIKSNKSQIMLILYNLEITLNKKIPQVPLPGEYDNILRYISSSIFMHIFLIFQKQITL